MNKLAKVWQSAFARPYVFWPAISLVFFVITWLHMGASLTHLNTVVLNSPGDHTAGIIYTSWVHPTSPIPGTSHFTNYPFGEDLRLPVTVSSQVLSIGHWSLSKFGSVVTGWNLLVLIGYMSNALLMFAFIRWLTKNNWAAFFSAYAITFTPYHVFASRGQIAGLYGSIFILALWQFISLWRKPHWIKGLSLGSILGISFYMDGYFILIGLVMFLSLWVASLTYGWRLKSLVKIKSQLMGLLVASATAFIWLSPLAYINYKFAARISSLLSNARGSIEANAQTYSAQLPMYVNPRSLIFLGFSVLALAATGVYFIRKTDLRDKSIASEAFLGWLLVVMSVLALWISLQPVLRVFGIPIIMPSKIIITLTSAWRVFGRLYSLISLGFITLAGLGLAKLLQKYPARRVAIAGVASLLLVVELGFYSHQPKAPNFNYQSAPEVYRWLTTQSDVKAIAEYPLDEPPQGQYLSDYFTYQQVSAKPMLNAFLPNSPEMPLRRSIVGINDPQTLSVLRALGIYLVNVRPVTQNEKEQDIRIAAGNNPGLLRLFSDSRAGFRVDSFRIQPGEKASYALVLANPTVQTTLTQTGSADFTVPEDPSLVLLKLPGAVSATSVRVVFNISALQNSNASIVQNGQTLWSGDLQTTSQELTVQVSPDFPITVYTQRSAGTNPVTLSKLRIAQ